MKSVIVAWCKTNDYDFENFVPLKFVGQRNQRLGFSNDLHVLFLDGYERLSGSYRNSLENLGYAIHDASHVFSEFDKKYYQLDRFGDYEKKCFLRWLVIEQFFAGEKIVHYDGDIVFNEDPAVIAKKVDGLTFVLQGCPAFTCIGDRLWFEQYKEQLDFFVKDIDGYSNQAWKERDGWEVTFKTQWSGSRFRKVITSDQDFISHLIHTGKIKQDSVEEILLGLRGYVLFENPLFIDIYDGNHPYKYLREKGIDYLLYRRFDDEDSWYKKKVLFWHMQSCFNFYVAKSIFRSRFLRFLPLGRLPLNLASKGFEDYINKKVGKYLHHTTRLDVYRYFFEKTDFSGVLRDSIWWKKGVFFR